MSGRPFKVPPGLRVRGLNPGTTAPSVNNYPVHVQRNLGGPNNMPGPNGGPGSDIWPYGENQYYGGNGGSSGLDASSVMPPAVGAPPLAPAADQLAMISTPYGQSQREWTNPTTYSTIPLLAGANGTILQLNFKRNSLIIQNTSTATSPDVAPTLYVGFNAQAVVGQCLSLPPGLGFYWGAADCPPRDAINVVFGPSVNGGGTVVVSGCVIQGTYVGANYIPPISGGSVTRIDRP